MIRFIILLVMAFCFSSIAYALPVGAVKLLDDTPSVAIKSKSLSQLKRTHLLTQSKTDNISLIFEKARAEGRLSIADQIKYAAKFKNLPNRDEILLACLKKEGCSLENAIKIASTSPLHNLVFIRSAPLSLTTANKLVGNVNEALMHKSFIRAGWKKINGEIGVNGIDGLYVKKNKSGVITDVLIAESKYNKSGLNKTANGKQMSKVWIKSHIEKLQAKYPDNKDYQSVKRFVDNDSYRSLVWNLKIDKGNMIFEVTKIHSKDGTIQKQKLLAGENINATYKKNQIISLSNPTNPYQMAMVNEFNLLTSPK